MSENQPQPMLRAEQVARELNISRTSAYRLMSSGKIRSVRVGERAIRTDWESLEDYKRRNTVTVQA
jgi:excisionase family DNA binding protein